MMTKWVYSFGDGKAEGRADMRNLLGGKGANLAEMSEPRPAGAAGLHHHHRGLHLVTTPTATTYPAELKDEVDDGAGRGREDRRRQASATPNNPLLVSVRSGARASMPGMMDTVLNLGLNDATVRGPGQASGDERFAYDSYRRFIQMYSQRRARRRTTTTSRRRSSSRRRTAASRSTPISTPTTGSSVVDELQEDRREAHRQAVPAGPARAALGRDRRGVRLAG